jgi:DNA-binding FadR family transcriptional regulator
MTTPEGEVKRVADVVLSRIFDGSYPAGLRLPAETALADELGCGRSTVREALRYLADLGLVRSRRGSGAHLLDYRREGTPSLLPAFLRAGHTGVPPHILAREMLRLRALMASEAVRLAARYATHAGLAEARALLERSRSIDDPVAHALNELDMYRALVAASGIWPAVWIVNAVWTPMREVNEMFARAMQSPRPDFFPTMVGVLEHVQSRNEDAAVEALRAWFDRVDAELVSLIETALNKEPPA